MYRRVLTTLLIGALLWMSEGPAHAQSTNSPDGNRDNRGWTDGSGVGATAGASESSDVGQPARSPAALPASFPICTYHDLSAEDSATADELSASGFGNRKGADPGKWVRKWCDVGGREIGSVEWSAIRAPSDPVQLAQQALKYAALAVPEIGINPSTDRDQLVNVPTWLWVDPADWRQVSASASAGGITVMTAATPRRVLWDPGDGGGPVECDGPGTPYNPSEPSATPTCTYTYRQPTERSVVTATIEWSVRWTSSAGGGGDLGSVRRSSSVPVRVAESQAINVSATGRPS